MATTDDSRLGTSISVFKVNEDGVPDLDPNGAPITGRQVVAEAVASRWSTPPKSLITDLDGTLDLRSLLSAAIDGSEDSITALRSALAHRALRDSRVKSIDISVTVTPALEKLSIKSAVTTSDDDSFEFVVGVDKLTVSIFAIDGVQVAA